MAVLALCVVSSEAAAMNDLEGPVQPSQWPSSAGLQPQIDGWENALRIWGPDRYQTNLSAALTFRGMGDFPYDTPDPTSGNAPSLSGAHDWWGVGQCPRSILLVAGDSPADSLIAASLSDPTGQSSEPYLRRSEAADPLFDPIGGFSRVDTDNAPILVTSSTRSGARSLSSATRAAIQDLRSGGCSQARQAVIVGGPSAIPVEVDTELVSIGINEVFRVEGVNRFATAAAVATALGTAASPTAECADISVIDGSARMSFYVNAAVEFRASATSCAVLEKSVVLADGVAGADALAAGWWTSFWQVPVLLHNGSEKLPATTRNALQSLDVSNLIVLGGEARIPESVVLEARSYSGATAHRIAGADRYATSVEMAKIFGGWWPTGRADEFSSSMVCIAASSGSGRKARGWPDALGAGPWCASASGGASNPGAPQRALGPLTGNTPALASIPDRPGHDAVPVLLVPSQFSSLPPVVEQFLTEAFEPADSWCSSVISPPGCAAPGFAVVFGGPSVVSDPIVSRVSWLVSGGRMSREMPINPRLEGPFFTELSMKPVFRESGTGQFQACVTRGGVENARWLAAGVGLSPAVTAIADVMLEGWHVEDNDGVTRDGPKGAPGCLKFNVGGFDDAWLRSIGPTGRSSSYSKFKVALAKRFSLTSHVASMSPTSFSGADTFEPKVRGGETILVLLSTQPQVGLVSEGMVSVVDSAGLTLTLNQVADGPRVVSDTFDATWNLATAIGTVYGRASGEALFDNGVWHLRGQAVVLGGSVARGQALGGFSAELAVNNSGLSDDVISWRFDASIPPS